MIYKSKVAKILLHDNQTPCKFQFLRTFVDNLEIKFIRDRGLDHAVEREKDLKPLINLKNLLKLEPSKSLPISTIVDNNETLKIPYRPIEFIRSYPSLFEEFFPANIGIHPHVRLTPKILDLDAQEQLIFDSDTVRKNAADRLLKLLMLCRVNEIPLKLIDRLKWDLGLPDNYVNTLVPEFPDYFQVKKGKNFEGVLELVCWSDDLSVSVLEKMAKKGDKGYEKGMPIEFPMEFSKGFEMDKRLKKWIDEWQKLPYVSPYENALHLQGNSDMSDRWVVAILHELLHILGPKKTERENVLCLGEYLGVKPRFKRAMAHHPGIFYLSSKIGTYTVVLREGYKRGVLVDANPLIDMRSKYIHLMHAPKEVQKPKKEASGDASRKKVVEGVVEKGNEDNVKAESEKMEVSDSDEDEDESEDEDEDEGEKVNEDDGESVGGRSGRRGYSKVNEEGRGRGRGGRGSGSGSGSGSGGRSESVNGRRGFSLERQERGERGGFDRGNREGQERGGNRSGRGGFQRGNWEMKESDGNRSDRRGFSRGNWEGKERGGGERGGFNRGNWEGKGRGGGERRSERSGFSRGNWEGKGRGEGERRSERSGFKKVDDEGQERGGSRSGRRGYGMFEEERPRSGYGRGGGTRGRGRRESAKF